MIIQLQFSSLKIIGLEVEIRISTHYFIVRKKAKEYEVFIKHISTNLIITDPMTQQISIKITGMVYLTHLMFDFIFF